MFHVWRRETWYYLTTDCNSVLVLFWVMRLKLEMDQDLSLTIGHKCISDWFQLKQTLYSHWKKSFDVAMIINIMIWLLQYVFLNNFCNLLEWLIFKQFQSWNSTKSTSIKVSILHREKKHHQYICQLLMKFIVNSWSVY